MTFLPTNIEILPCQGDTLYVNRSNDQVLRSCDFTPDALRAIADHLESHTPVPIPVVSIPPLINTGFQPGAAANRNPETVSTVSHH